MLTPLQRWCQHKRSTGPFGNEAQSVMDAWRRLVMVHALARAELEGQ